jgi:hypothetical protein
MNKLHCLINAPRHKYFLKSRRDFMNCWRLKGKEALEALRDRAVVEEGVKVENEKFKGGLPKMETWLSDYTARTGFC